MEQLVCAVDLGSTAVKAALVGPDSRIVALGRARAPLPRGELGTFDADECAAAVCAAIREAVEQHPTRAAAVQGIALSSQRASCVLVGADGRACGPALSWQGAGCEPAATRFYAGLGAGRFAELTGLQPAPIYTVAKLAHLRAAEPARLAAARRVVLLHDYVLRRLGAPDFYTDPSNASASGLLQLADHAWCAPILEQLGLAADRLPLCRPAGTAVGGLDDPAARRSGLASGTPLFVGGGDQQCAALGAGAADPGACVLSLGTAGVVLCPTDRAGARAGVGLLCTAHLPAERWLLEGFHSSFGGSFNWAAQLLGCGSFPELEQLAARGAPGADGLIYLPFLVGIGTPEFDGTVRGALLGANPGHGPAELARAVIDGVAFETRRIVEQVERTVSVRGLRATGGAAAPGLVTQTLADCLGRELQLLGDREGALLGAAAVVWTGVGRHGDLRAAARELAELAPGELVRPADSAPDGEARYRRYVAAVEAARDFQRRVEERTESRRDD